MESNLEMEETTSPGKDLEAIEGLKNLKEKETRVAWVCNDCWN